MLKPSMNELMKRVGNRYLLVNLAAQRARDVADDADEMGEPLDEKAVQLALDEIADGEIVYAPGPKPERIRPIIKASDLAETLDLDADGGVAMEMVEQSIEEEQPESNGNMEETNGEEL